MEEWNKRGKEGEPGEKKREREDKSIVEKGEKEN